MNERFAQGNGQLICIFCAHLMASKTNKTNSSQWGKKSCVTHQKSIDKQNAINVVLWQWLKPTKLYLRSVPKMPMVQIRAVSTQILFSLCKYSKCTFAKYMHSKSKKFVFVFCRDKNTSILKIFGKPIENVCLFCYIDKMRSVWA